MLFHDNCINQLQSGQNRILSPRAACNNNDFFSRATVAAQQQLGLCLPPLRHDNNNLGNIPAAHECRNGMNQDRLACQDQELLGDCRIHSGAASGGSNYCCSRAGHLSARISVVMTHVCLDELRQL